MPVTRVVSPPAGTRRRPAKRRKSNGLAGEASGGHVGQSGLRALLNALPFLTPSFIGVMLFLVIPVIVLFVISFLNWDLLTPATVAGFENYLNIFRFDGAAHSLGVTFYYVLLNIPLQTVLALGLAVLLNSKRRGMGIYRVLYVAP